MKTALQKEQKVAKNAAFKLFFAPELEEWASFLLN